MGNVAFFWLGRVRIICTALTKKIRGGRQYWRGRVFAFGVQRAEVGCSESCKAGREFDHVWEPPRKARFTIGIDHSGAFIKAHVAGRFGPSSFVLTGE